MKRRYKYPAYVLGFLAVALGVFAILISHDSSCGTAPAVAAGAATMKAARYRCYGGPDVVRVESVARPTLADDELLVKVRASSVNPLDWHYLRGTPYIMRMDVGLGAPKEAGLGVDFSGVVEAVGKSVTRFKPGDEVFGGRNGAFAEYVRVRESRAVARKPATASFEEAAALPIAAITALQALRDQAGVKAGQKVLVNGASGGVGSYAVQLAKQMGAEVTGVCSARNAEMVRGLGADRVIDYQRTDFTTGGERYDAIIDTVGNHDLREIRRVLAPHGTAVMIGAPNDGPWLGPLKLPIKIMAYQPFVAENFKFFLAELNPDDLEKLASLMADGKLKSVIDRRYSLDRIAEAIAYVEQGHTRGKVIVTMP